jgi:DNA-binding response OmpR family regulator
MPLDEQTPVGKRSVLCVQPNADYHPALRLALSKYRTVLTLSALDAIRAFNAASFDAYVLDYWLPDWTGAGLCREIRKSDPHAPICFFTQAESSEQNKRGLRAGAQAYVSAPEGATALAAKLRTLLGDVDVRALQAKRELEQVVREEVERRAVLALDATEHARERVAKALERAAYTRGRTVFVDAGGTIATFERWWPQVFGSVLANHGASK